jgi:3-hydroxyacyl-[acyl-carrier-protein] dehydratase
MPAVPLIDFDALDLGKVVATREDIRRVIMQRGRMELLDGIAHVDRENALVVAFVDVRGDAWWASDHVPGRPLFPGVLMIEAAAQMCTYDFMHRQPDMQGTFVGFAGVDRVRFRAAVEPELPHALRRARDAHPEQHVLLHHPELRRAQARVRGRHPRHGGLAAGVQPGPEARRADLRGRLAEPSASRMASTSSSRHTHGTPTRPPSEGTVAPASPLRTSLT